MKWYAIDPGETTGWARFNDNVEAPEAVGEVKYKDFFQFLRDAASVACWWVVEDYLIRPEVMPSRGRIAYKNNHGWSDGKTLRLIGAIQYSAHLQNVAVYLQQPSIKPMAYKMIGQEYVRGKKNMHMSDAIAHGVYYLRRAHNRAMGA